jgi:hypothetical protein
MVEEQRRIGVHGRDERQFFSAQFEVEDVEVFGHPFGSHGLGDDHNVITSWSIAQRPSEGAASGQGVTPWA